MFIVEKTGIGIFALLAFSTYEMHQTHESPYVYFPLFWFLVTE